MRIPNGQKSPVQVTKNMLRDHGNHGFFRWSERHEIPTRTLLQQPRHSILGLSNSIVFAYSKRRLRLKKVVRRPLATLSKDMVEVTSAENDPFLYEATAVVTIRKSETGSMRNMVSDWLHTFASERATKNDGYVTLQLVSMESIKTDPDKGITVPRVSREAVLQSSSIIQAEGTKITYTVEFTMDNKFGMPGAILVANKSEDEFFLESIIFEGIVHFEYSSWVQPYRIHPKKRIFFCNKAYLPSKTPTGLRQLRQEELLELRGDGSGVRKPSDRIYDYDMYNDLGNPDKGLEYERPTLGGAKNPHPRRCRTGRIPTKTDPDAESPVEDNILIYVPRDERLSELKKEALESHKLKGKLRNAIPFMQETISKGADVFDGYTNLSNLYKERPFPQLKSRENSWDWLPVPFDKALKQIKESLDDSLKFDPPKVMPRGTFLLSDDEFGRRAITGLNPLNIEKLQAFPPRSKLDPLIYGPQESALHQGHIIGNLNGMSVHQAIDESRLYILDYHDWYLPFLDLINSQRGRKAHATRTIFFLTDTGTLKPIAIELCNSTASGSNPSTKQVLLPPVDGTTNWLWQLGKAHVSANDAGVHQLVNHWLRTHACMEPFIIAAHRQLSAMHPIYKLLHPHMKYTLQINAMTREELINAGGIVERDFTPGRYCMQFSAAAYRDWWRFDMEGLPADLIRRGVAIPDPSRPHGLRLLIDDYPYANDGLLIWSAIEELVQTYVNYYYTDEDQIQSDTELQSWYSEAVNVGHADLCRASWWPKLNSPRDLSSILTVLIWQASANHAVLHFGQYAYSGYVPVRPPLMRRLVPQEHDPEYGAFIADPHKFFMSSIPSLFQATKFTAVTDVASAHSPDEEYIGQRDLSAWSGEPDIVAAFYRFSAHMKRIEEIIEKRNANPNLRNRCGAGVTSYELLIPSSGPGVTSRGVPNSITS